MLKYINNRFNPALNKVTRGLAMAYAPTLMSDTHNAIPGEKTSKAEHLLERCPALDMRDE